MLFPDSNKPFSSGHKYSTAHSSVSSRPMPISSSSLPSSLTDFSFFVLSTWFPLLLLLLLPFLPYSLPLSLPRFFFRLRLLFITGSFHASACFDDALLTHPLPAPSRPIPPTNADAALLPPHIRLPPRPQPPRTNKRTNERTTERQHTRTGPGWAELGLAGPGLGQWMVKSGTPGVVVGCRFVNMCVPGHPDRPPTANECMPCTHASMYGCYLPTTQCIFFGGASAPACGLRPRA